MRYILIYAIVLLLSGCSESVSIILTNTSSVALENQPVILKREKFDLEEGDYLIFSTAEDSPIPAQFDDLDNDGTWDEVALIVDFPGSSSISLFYEVVSEEKLPELERRTAIHFGYSPEKDGNFTPVEENVRPKDHIAQSKPYIYQYEGPGWESELVAFRSYFDSRNGKDIFTKTRPELMLKQIGLGENYHELQEWGMDVLKVGNSLGSGALAMLKNDSLYRLTNTDKATFKIITQGPVRSILTLEYEGWQVDDESYDITETISIWAGKRHYESKVTLSGNSADTLVTGIVNLNELEAKFTENGDAKVMYTHGVQSENKDMLGMGLIIPDANFVAFDEAPEEGDGIVDTYTAYLKPANGVYRFAFYTGWELGDAAFKDDAAFRGRLESVTTGLLNPIKITE